MSQSATTTELSLDQWAELALQRPADIPAIEFDKVWVCWGELQHLATNLREQLAQQQVYAGANVALIARNHPACVAAFVGLIAAELNIRMIYPFQSSTGIAREVEELKPAAVIALTEDLGNEVTSAARHCDSCAIALSWPGVELVNGRASSEQLAGDTESLAIEILTSGTTGKPKPFKVSYDMLARHMLAGLKPDDVDANAQEPVLLYFPVGNISGLYTTLPAILGGRRVVLLERFNIDAWHDFVLRYRPSAGGLPPAAVQMVLDAEIPKDDLSSIRFFGVGAAPLDPAVQAAFEQRYDIPILLSYGATEFGGPVTRMTPDMHAQDGERKRGTVGKPLPGVKLRVIDPESEQVLPANSEGILEVVSPRIGPDWIRTSDIARIDEDGYLFHCGRADGAIVRGGFKILPETVERALLAHPAVSSAAVVGLPDRRLGQVPVAAVVLKPGQAVSQDTLMAFLRERVLKTHLPTQWRFVDALPRTKLSYKVDQAAVRALFQ